MNFTKASILVATTLSTSVYAQLTALQIASNISIITPQSQALQSPADNINILSDPLFLISQGLFPVDFPPLALALDCLNTYIDATENDQVLEVDAKETLRIVCAIMQ